MIATPLGRHADDDLVAFGEGGPRTAADLRRDAAAIARALPAPATEDAHVVLVFTSDRYAFAAALLGAWSAGFKAALPPNTRRDTIGELLARDDAAHLLHDTAAGLGVRVPPLLAAVDGEAHDPVQLPALDADAHVATAFTSGSTGEATAWPKTAGQLFGEIAALARLLELDAGVRVVPTVGPSHIYGLLWGVLLPLCVGGAFLRETPLLPEAIAARTRDHAGAVLISVPAHLRAFEALARGALGDIARIVTSTAPLAAETAAMLRERHGLAATEILGSTETGGVAWRTRRGADEEAHDHAWSPLPEVSVAIDDGGRLSVDSPFVDPALPRPYRTQDLAEAAPDGRFVHRGRADDVVKIGGRRVSLRAMEAALSRQAGVDDAAVLAIPDPTGRNQRLVALVVAPGRDPEDLRRALEASFDPSTLPRRIRALRALPREANGKLQRARALRAIGLGPDGRPRAFALEWLEDAAEGEHAHAFAARVPENFAWYDGHFATYPVMAGAVQLHDVIRPCLARALPEHRPIAALQRVKFLARIAPGDTIAVRLAWDVGADWVDFTIRVRDETASGGRVVFAHRPDAGGASA